MSLQIINLHAENYKRLKAVDITPEGNVVFIGGRNAQGKTSVLDAIWAALAGGEASRATAQPIRDGQDTAVVRLDLGDYIVTRRWTKDDSGTLTVESPEGAKFGTPQKLLDSVIGARAFDPLAFTRMSAKEQVAALVGMVDLPFDPEVLERERKGVFDTRTEVNREVTRLEGQLAGFPAPDASLPEAEVSVSALLAEADAAREQNARIDAAFDELARRQSAREAAERAVAAAQEALRGAQQAEHEHLAAYKALPDPIDTSAITSRLGDVEQTNARIREQQQRAAVAAELSERKERAAQHTLALQGIEKRKADALAAVEFPVPGLSFDESGVTFNGIPFSQASAAEQLRVSVALAMAANPTLRVLRILDGSLLDDDSMRIIAELAAENSYQVWVEVVGETGGVGFVLEDGEVRP